MATIVGAAGGGNWTTGSTWVGGTAPTAADDAQLISTSGNVTIDTGSVCRSLDCTGYTGTLTHTTAVIFNIGDATAGAGNIAFRMVSGMTYTLGNAQTSETRLISTSATQQTVITGTKVLGNTRFSGVDGSYLLGDNFTATGFVTVQGSILDVSASNFIITAERVIMNHLSSVLTLRAATHVLTGVGSLNTPWNFLSGTLNTNTSTIRITDTSNTAITFAGNGGTYNNVSFERGASTASITIEGSNTFAAFKDTGTAAHSLLFTAGTTQTVATFTVSGTVGNLITLNSTTTATFALVKSGGGTIFRNYLNIQHSVATPGSTWEAGWSNSVNNQGVADAGSGWSFSPQILYTNDPTRNSGSRTTHDPTIAQSASSGGQIKYWNGSIWTAKPVKYWNGSTWVVKPVKYWTGSVWTTTSY